MVGYNLRPLPSYERNKLRKEHLYRTFVGPAEKYDLISAMQFNLLTFLGLKEHHFLLDIGCGSLRGGKLFIPYLLPGRYFGIEPEQWLIQEVVENELGDDIIRIKRPVLKNDSDFTLSIFDRKFDFLLAQSIFSHSSQQQIRKCLSEAKKVMMPTSIFAATFVRGEKSYSANEWVYPQCITYTLDCMTNLIEEQGLICRPIDWPHPNQQTWILIVNPKNEKNIPDLNHNIKQQLQHQYEMVSLENELRHHKQRLLKIESHPYVRLGLKVKRSIRLIFRRN